MPQPGCVRAAAARPRPRGRRRCRRAGRGRRPGDDRRPRRAWRAARRATRRRPGAGADRRRGRPPRAGSAGCDRRPARRRRRRAAPHPRRPRPVARPGRGAARAPAGAAPRGGAAARLRRAAGVRGHRRTPDSLGRHTGGRRRRAARNRGERSHRSHRRPVRLGWDERVRARAVPRRPRPDPHHAGVRDPHRAGGRGRAALRVGVRRRRVHRRRSRACTAGSRHGWTGRRRGDHQHDGRQCRRLAGDHRRLVGRGAGEPQLLRGGRAGAEATGCGAAGRAAGRPRDVGPQRRPGGTVATARRADRDGRRGCGAEHRRACRRRRAGVGGRLPRHGDHAEPERRGLVPAGPGGRRSAADRAVTSSGVVVAERVGDRGHGGVGRRDPADPATRPAPRRTAAPAVDRRHRRGPTGGRRRRDGADWPDRRHRQRHRCGGRAGTGGRPVRLARRIRPTAGVQATRRCGPGRRPRGGVGRRLPLHRRRRRLVRRCARPRGARRRGLRGGDHRHQAARRRRLVDVLRLVPRPAIDPARVRVHAHRRRWRRRDQPGDRRRRPRIGGALRFARHDSVPRGPDRRRPDHHRGVPVDLPAGRRQLRLRTDRQDRLGHAQR